MGMPFIWLKGNIDGVDVNYQCYLGGKLEIEYWDENTQEWKPIGGKG